MDAPTKEIQMPIDRLSYSSLTQLLRNPLVFKLKYILGIYNTKMSVSGMIGRAVHESLKAYYGGNPNVSISVDKADAIAEVRELGLQYLSAQSDDFIDYGKTGSREAMLKGFSQALDFYFAEEPEYHKILMCEQKLDAEILTVDGDLLPLPATGIPDLVVENKDGTIDVIDFKITSGFTEYESEDFIKIIQSQFLYHLLLTKGITPTRMIFREIKKSQNKDGSPQVRDWVVPFNHEPYRIIFYNIYRDVVKFISNPHAIYLPNIADNFDGEHAGLLYAQGLISADMSDVEVMHKVRDVALVSKKFVPSRLDKVENQNLLPEEKIKLRLAEFGIPVEPVETKVGATVTQYRFKVSAGVRMQTIKKHKDDIARAVETTGHINILAPIPGTSLVGVEIENKNRSAVKLTDEHYVKHTLSLPIGSDVHGDITKLPLDEMPHLLIAGATGSGKSVLLNTLITALLEQNTQYEMELVLIDPKRVELARFAKKPHVNGKGIIYEYEDAMRALLTLADEMERRYKLLEKTKTRDIGEYNKKRSTKSYHLARIVVVVDEFADFMMRSKTMAGKYKISGYHSKSRSQLYRELEKRSPEALYDGAGSQRGFTKGELIEVLESMDAKDDMKRADADIEHLVVRLAQMGRAAGIHLIIATQRPSVDVVTGLIKANFPTRIALTTSSPTDSVVILGQPGAEKLSGKGDLLLMSPLLRGIQRLQGLVI